VTMNNWNAMCYYTETWTDVPEEKKHFWNLQRQLCAVVKTTAPFSPKHNASNQNVKSYICQRDMFCNCKDTSRKGQHQVPRT
jgi:hypothetical protein